MADTPALQALQASGLEFQTVRTQQAGSAEESAELQGIEHLSPRALIAQLGAEIADVTADDAKPA